MKKTLLASVAAIGLIGGANMAFAQGSPAAAPGPGGAKGAPAATQSAPSAPSSTMDRASPSGPAATAPAEESPSATSPRAEDGKRPQNQKTGQGGSQPTKGGMKQGENERPAAGAKQGENERTPAAGGSKQGAAERPMNSKSVSLTTEQKTTIRKTVLTSSAPRVTGRVNFDIRVGTVVPRTVRVVALPRAILEIEPEWRGYMYFVSGDQIIVVEPRTLEIVAVLDV